MSSYRNLIAASLLVLVASVAHSQEKKTEAVAAQPTTPQPAVFTWGGDLRFRYEGYDSVQTLNEDAPFHVRDYDRVRTRAWANYVPFTDTAINVRLTAEPRYWYNNSTVAGEGREWRYAIIDNLYVKWGTPATGNVPVSVTVGRQDIQLGDQWLVGDGTPLDGSWTNFFDSARATIDLQDLKTKLDVIVLDQQAHPKDHLPIIGRQAAYSLMEQDEKGAILYATNKSIKNIQIDGYLIYKKDSKVTSSGNNGEVYTAGARVAGALSPKWQYTAELAYQWGRRDLQVRYPSTQTSSRDIVANGSIAKLTYLFKDTLNNQITFLTEYLSGDDPDTAGTDEMFDVLWGRYPRVGETWAAAYAPETGGRSAQYQNLNRFGVTWTISPTKDTSIATSYFAMFAPESAPTRATSNALFSRDGNFRGHTLQVIAKHKFNKMLSALLYAEASFLGDYYTHHDRITFVRTELTFSF